MYMLIECTCMYSTYSLNVHVHKYVLYMYSTYSLNVHVHKYVLYMYSTYSLNVHVHKYTCTCTVHTH